VIHPVEEDRTMPQPLSVDLRRRFQAYLAEGLSGREAARRLRISAATASRLGRRIARGEPLEARPSGGSRGRGKLAPHEGFLIELVTQDPDITLYELRDALEAAEGLRVHHSAIDRALIRLGYAFKKRASLPMSAANPGSGERAKTG
jgi:transposase